MTVAEPSPFPWGKLSHLPDGAVRTHPLLDHMTDVAAVLETLLHLPGVKRALERAAGRPLSAVDRARLAVLTFLHDVGKANAGFQVRYWPERARRPAAWNVAECGHGPQGWTLFGQSLHGAARVTAGLPLEAMEGWGEAVRPLLYASISHHGRPVGDEATFSIWQPVRDGALCLYDPADTVAALDRPAADSRQDQGHRGSRRGQPDPPAGSRNPAARDRPDRRPGRDGRSGRRCRSGFGRRLRFQLGEQSGQHVLVGTHLLCHRGEHCFIHRKALP